MLRLADQLHTSFVHNAERSAVEIPGASISLTYRQLREGAQRWAAARGTGERTIVACLAKSAEFYELAAAAFLYGWDFCPLDPANPADRIARVCEQLPNTWLVTDTDERAAHLARAGLDVGRPEDRPATGFDPPPGGGSYYIATSGTTGTPKLVQVDHDATLPFVSWALPFYRVDHSSRWSQFNSVGFDLSIVDMLVAWRAGATLVAVSSMAERTRLNRFVNDQRITHWHSVPSMIPNLVRGGTLSQLQVVSLCGEPLLRASALQLRECAPSTRIVNTYGPTEGPLFCTFHEVDDDTLSDEALSTVPIGEPIPGYSLRLVDDDLDERGGTVRAVIIGERLADGYVGIDSPAFAAIEVDGRQMQSFDTGDYLAKVGRHLCFSHRRDGQVKLGGVRFELGEVADACVRAGLSEPTVLFHDDRLVVFHRGVDGGHAALDTNQRSLVLARLRELLPDAAVPTDLRFLAELPRTMSDKVDRAALASHL
jgi:non-ribosomal peptide synthetase component F